MRTKTNPDDTEAAGAWTKASLRAQIETRAYHLWLEGGGRHGAALEHWLRAESEILKASAQDRAERSLAREASAGSKLRPSSVPNEPIRKK